MAGVPTFGLRPFNIYGPRQHASSPYSGVITVFADRLRRGEKLTIYGDGKQTRDFIHVNDVVGFFVAALSKASPDAPICNAATGKETSVLDVAQKLGAVFSREARHHLRARARGRHLPLGRRYVARQDDVGLHRQNRDQRRAEIRAWH